MLKFINKILVGCNYIIAFFFIFIGDLRSGRAAALDVSWDKELPGMVCRKVDISAGSLPRAWQEISSTLLLRSVLVAAHDFSTEGSFSLKKDQCTGGEIFNALVSAYPKFVWEQDRESGVVWIFPKKMTLEAILSQKVRVPLRSGGLRMQQDILDNLALNPLFEVGVEAGSKFSYGTFYRPVNLEKGDYSIRRILNCCCADNPSWGFIITLTSGGACPYYIMPVNLNMEKTTEMAPGVQLWWKLRVKKQIKDRSPSLSEIGDALSDPRPEVRRAAQSYIHAFNFPYDEKLMKLAQNNINGLWTIVSILNVFSIGNNDEYPPVIKKMHEIIEANPDILSRGDCGLVLLCALELMRLGNDDGVFQIVRTRQVKIEDIQPVCDHVVRVLRLLKETDQWPKIQDWLSTLPELKEQVTSQRLFEAVVEK